MSTISVKDYQKISGRSKETPETAVKRQIKEYLDVLGIFHFPITQGMGSYKGIPDRIAIKNGVSYYIEIKAENGKQSPYQKQFQADVERSGGIYILAKGISDLKCLDDRKRLL